MSTPRWTDTPLFDASWTPDDGAQLDLFTGQVADDPTRAPRLLPDSWREPITNHQENHP